jgi:hypothetical protein
LNEGRTAGKGTRDGPHQIKKESRGSATKMRPKRREKVVAQGGFNFFYLVGWLVTSTMKNEKYFFSTQFSSSVLYETKTRGRDCLRVYGSLFSVDVCAFRTGGKE